MNASEFWKCVDGLTRQYRFPQDWMKLSEEQLRGSVGAFLADMGGLASSWYNDKDKDEDTKDSQEVSKP